MNKNYLKYNNLGILVDSQLEQVSQGNHNVDYYYIAYDVYDYTNGYVTVSVTLPDGTQLPELATSPKEFEFEGNTYKGFVFVLRDILTAETGTLSMTFNLKSAENDTQLCSSRLNVTIHESDMHTSPTITDAQYEQMQEVIRENTVKVDEALAKANDALYHDATIVKVNGEVQQTWDATYAQKITEESANKVNVTNYNTGSLSAYAWVIKGSLKLEANKTYTISFYTTSSISANQVYLNENYFKKNTSIVGDYYFTDSYAQNTLATKTITTITDITIEKDTLLKCTTAREYPIRNFMINEGTEALPYSPYNQKRHITNPQADLLKSEWEKSVNLFNYKNIGSGFLDPNSGNIYTNSGWVYGKHYSKVDSNTTYTLSWVGGTFYQANICFYDNSKTFISGVKLEKNKATKMSFTTPNNTSYITVGYTINNAVDGDIEKTNVMLNEGPEALPYQEWNGSIIHEKDIDPVLLWENGNPNNEFVGKEYDTFNRTPYKRFLLGYYITPGSAIKFIEINNASNSGGALTDLWAYENGATIYNLIRKFSLTSSNQTKITFGDCYQGTSVVNTRMIPAILYGLYY